MSVLTYISRMPARRYMAAGVLAAGALLLSACADNDGMAGHSASATAEPGKGNAAAGFNDADVMFAQQMIPHHKQALAMAELAEGRAADPEVKKLAEQIEKAQDPEINTMQGWLKAWGKPAATPSMPGMDHGEMEGMMSEEDMQKLQTMKGTEFDRAFSEMMIEHHNGAITMAEEEQRTGKHAGAKKLAGDIIEGQTAEVRQFEAILDRL